MHVKRDYLRDLAVHAVAWTIADLAGRERPRVDDVTAASGHTKPR